MENASKALIIAGAILISILIIGLGVFIFGKAKGTVGKVDLSSTEAQAQNQQFEAYFGENVSAQEVKSLLSLIRTNNLTGEKNGDIRTIAVIYQDGTSATASNITTDVSGFLKDIKTGYTYTVNANSDKAATDSSVIVKENDTDVAGYYSSGYLRIIKIVKNTTKTTP